MISKISLYLEKYPVISQFIRFGIVGTIGAAVDFGSYGIITRLLHFTETINIFGYPVIVANMISVFLAIISNFFWNKYWTFKDYAGESMASQWTQFFILSAITYILNQAMVSFIVFSTVLSFEKLFGSKEDLAAKVIATGIIMFLNFGISKFIVFNKK